MATRSSMRMEATTKTSGFAAFTLFRIPEKSAVPFGNVSKRTRSKPFFLASSRAPPGHPVRDQRAVLIDHCQGSEPVASREIKHAFRHGLYGRNHHDEVPASLL